MTDKDELAQAVARTDAWLESYGNEASRVDLDDPQSPTFADLRLILAALHAAREDAGRLDWMDATAAFVSHTFEDAWEFDVDPYRFMGDPVEVQAFDIRKAIDTARATQPEEAT